MRSRIPGGGAHGGNEAAGGVVFARLTQGGADAIAFAIVGDLANTGEEFDCAAYLDRHPKVRYWVRNIERKKSSFWLQLPNA